MISQAISALHSGSPILIHDDGSLAPCFFLLCPASHINEDTIAFFLNIGRGNILVSIREEHSKGIGLSSIAKTNSQNYQMTIGVEAREGVGSGISARDRAQTVRAILNSNQQTRLIVGPGHIYPITAHKDGLLIKSGIAEAACDLLFLAKLPEVGVLTHCLNEKGSFLSKEESLILSKNHNLPIFKISDLVQYRLINEKLVRKISEAQLPTKNFGMLKAECFISKHDNAEHLVLTKGTLNKEEAVFTRMHSEKKIADIFTLENFNERQKINSSLDYISKISSGILVYIKKNNKNSLNVPFSRDLLPSQKMSELRELGIGANILRELNINKIKLLTTQKKVLNSLEAYGIKIVEQVIIYPSGFKFPLGNLN